MTPYTKDGSRLLATSIMCIDINRWRRALISDTSPVFRARSTLRLAAWESWPITARTSLSPSVRMEMCFLNVIPLGRLRLYCGGTDKCGKVLAINGLLIQDFETGSRQIHLAHQTEPLLLSPNSRHFAGLMADVLNLLTNRLVVREVKTNYACYRQGETIQDPGASRIGELRVQRG